MSRAWPRTKIELYAAALAARLPRTVPLMGALRAAGARDQACRAAYEELSQRRAANMRLFAEDLVATGELRADVTVDEIATLVWSMNSPDYFTAARRGRPHAPGVRRPAGPGLEPDVPRGSRVRGAFVREEERRR